MPKANLEFRKIPSLKFLYEISQNGVVRNAKSKRYLQRLSTPQGDKVYISQFQLVAVKDLLEECWAKNNTAVKITLTKDGKSISFTSKNDAARYIAHVTSSSMITTRIKLSHRRKHVQGFNVSYVNAETVR